MPTELYRKAPGSAACFNPVPHCNADPLCLGPSPGGLTVPGSPLLSAAEVLRAGLFCGPVETVRRQQKLKSLSLGSRAGGTRWAAALSPDGVGVRPGSGLEPERGHFPARAQGWLWGTQQEGSDAQEATPLLPGKAAGWRGQEEGCCRPKVSGDDGRGEKHQTRGTWTNTLTRGRRVGAWGGCSCPLPSEWAEPARWLQKQPLYV